MYLKELSLRGFKSFADRTVLQFEPGVTVVVGPNGTGKSNITDSFLWVLGEQSPRSLRGAAMEDVIFDGSLLRPSLGLAEVCLTLDNSDGQLPIEFSEVTIGRRVLRTGESEYLLNGSSVRLLDIQELLSDSGIGREMYSVLSQGRLEEVLNAQPDERGILLEEAAGIYKYRKRKERAVRKLQSTKESLNRLQDLLAEIKRQVDPLKKQADRTQMHQSVQEELRKYEIALAVVELKNLRRDWEAIKRSQQELTNRLDELRKVRGQLEERIDRFQVQLEEKGVYAGDLGESRRMLHGMNEKLRAGLLLLEEKGKNLVQRLSELRQTLHRFDRDQKARLSEIQGLKGGGEGVATELSESYGALAQEQRRTERLKEETTTLKRRLKAARKELAEKRHELRKTEQEATSLKLSQASLQSGLRRVHEQEAALTEDKERIQKVLAKVKRECSQESCALVENACEKLGKIEKELQRTMRKSRLWTAKVQEGKVAGVRQTEALAALVKAIDSGEKDLEICVGELELKRHEESEHTTEVHRLRYRISNLSDEKNRCEQRVATLEKEVAEDENQGRMARQTLVALDSLRHRVQPVHLLYSRLIQEGSAWALRLERMAAGEGALSQTLRDDLKEAQSQSRVLAGQVEESVRKERELEARCAEVEVKVNDLAKKIAEEWGVPLEKALVTEVEAKVDGIKGKMRRLRQKLAELGEINPLAVKEWRAVDDRHRFLSDQISDLTKSRQSLTRVIKVVEKRMDKNFREVFERVDSRFREIFAYLFPGGKAELSLVEGEEPGRGGVDVQAQPSGKKFKKLSLLSGGERALTALAFFFAVCQVRPSPFYILDEVEPSLDDVNLKRFLTLINRFRKETQFIIITHQRRTMEVADSLYGISMQADGVSKVLSQKLAPEERALLQTHEPSAEWAPGPAPP